MNDMNNTLEDLQTSASQAQKAAIFSSDKSNVKGFPSPPLITLRSPLLPPSAPEKKTVLLKGNRKNEDPEETLASSIPNPFPELFTSPVSSVVCQCLVPWTETSKTQ